MRLSDASTRPAALGVLVLAWVACSGARTGTQAADGEGAAGRASDAGLASDASTRSGPRRDASVSTEAGAAPGGDGGGRALDAASSTDGADAGALVPGWNLVAFDTSRRTYLALFEVPENGRFMPSSAELPALARWEGQTEYSALRAKAFTPGQVLPPAQIIALLPTLAPAVRSISITDPPYRAATSPADASDAIQAALDAAAAMARPGAPVDVLVPPGSFDHSKVLTLGADVRLRRSPEDSGGVLHATDPAHAAVHLAGDRSAALFLLLRSDAPARATTPDSGGVWVGARTAAGPFIHDPVVVGNEIDKPAGAHVFGIAEEGGLWAFNYAHDGYADTFHHTGGSRFCQVIGNRAQTSADRGDDLYAFVGYQGDGDPVHHCACIANFGRDGHARGLSAVGAGFIAFEHNDIDRTQWAGVYLAQEDSYQTYGSFELSVIGNLIADANLAGSHDGLLAFSDHPSTSHASASFGDLSDQVRKLSIRGNTFRSTAAGIGNGFAIEIRASVAEGEVIDNTLEHNRSPQLVLNGTNFNASGNQIIP